ncbi:hypothetical protein Bcp1_026 [Bacillus phage Bcp1]|uniref:Uncharacterized protein n=1 Tax=Bacillus phage Bcp1 TaxID=584892 RepID=X2JN28_9CAUD|nr:hypothetical protein Bcp1_026 [Bacillus phage Bcp1]AHN66503.1 hypothetical protein Bcp1_026 [Bacillus phage Bcp1]
MDESSTDIDEKIRAARLDKYGVPFYIPLGEEWRCSNMYQSFHPSGSTWREIRAMEISMRKQYEISARKNRIVSAFKRLFN